MFWKISWNIFQQKTWQQLAWFASSSTRQWSKVHCIFTYTFFLLNINKIYKFVLTELSRMAASGNVINVRVRNRDQEDPTDLVHDAQEADLSLAHIHMKMWVLRCADNHFATVKGSYLHRYTDCFSLTYPASIVFNPFLPFQCCSQWGQSPGSGAPPSRR